MSKKWSAPRLRTYEPVDEAVERAKSIESKDPLQARAESGAQAGAEHSGRDAARERELMDQRAADSSPEDAFHIPAEERMRLLRSAVEQSGESVIIMTARLDPLHLKIVYVNPAFTKMTGYEPEEVI